MERAPELEQAMKDLYAAMGRGDGGFLRDFVSESDGVTMIATDPNEYWTDHGTITRVWAQQLDEMGGLDIQPGELRAYRDGDVGWAADRPTIRMPDGSELPFRITAVYTRENGGWKLVQGHASIGVANEEALGQELTTG